MRWHAAAWLAAFAVPALAVPALTVQGLTVQAWADEPPVVRITLKDHRFDPAEIHIPAGRPTMLEISNADPTPDEFEMRQIAIEKVVTGGGRVRVRLRPMAPGRYDYIGEFHEATAKGVIIVE